MVQKKKEDLRDKSKKNEEKKQDLDEIPEGGLADIMKVLGPALQFYTRVRLYKLLKLIPLHLRYAFWTFVGSIVWRLKATRKIINNGIESLRLIFPNKSPEEILTISKNSWRLMGYGFFSLLLVDVPNWNEKNLAKYVEFQGLEHIDNALKRGKGVIVASTHVGLLPAMYVGMALKGYKTNIIANVRVSGPLVAIRPIPGIRCIPTGSMEGSNSIRPKLHYALKQNQLLYIFADFSQRKQMGIRFLGKLGHTPAGIPVLAQETGAAIIPAFTYPKSINQMVIHFQPEYNLIQREGMSKKEFLGENMLELNNLMTWLIRKAPVLYFEHTSYEMLKVYRRETRVMQGNSREVGLKLLELAQQVIDTTYERGRRDDRYTKNIANLTQMVFDVPDSEISEKKFDAYFHVGWHHVRDSFIQMCREALKLDLDKPIVKIIYKAMQDLVISPL